MANLSFLLISEYQLLQIHNMNDIYLKNKLIRNKRLTLNLLKFKKLYKNKYYLTKKFF